MVATLDLTESEMNDLRELTLHQDASAALRVAVPEYVRYARRMQLKELSGRVTMEYPPCTESCLESSSI